MELYSYAYTVVIFYGLLAFYYKYKRTFLKFYQVNLGIKLGFIVS